MNLRWTVFEILINIFEGWLYTFFLNRKMERKPCLPNRKVHLATMGTIFGVALFYSLYIWVELPLNDLVVFLITLAYSAYLFTDKWYIKALWNIMLGIVLVSCASFTSLLYINIAGVSWEVLMAPSLLRVSFVLVTNAIMFVVYYIIGHIQPKQEKLSWFSLALFVLLNVILLIALEMQYHLSWQENVPKEPVLVTIFCMLFVIAGLLALFELLSYKALKQAELEVQIESSNMIQAYIEEVRTMYQYMKDYEHDMKHQVNTLKIMIQEGKIGESSAYLEELERMVLPEHYATGCIEVDALLSAKSAYMRQFDIRLEYIPYPLNELPVGIPIFCSIIGNLIDNAIEGIQRIHDRSKEYVIQLSFSRTRDMFYITCKNETGGVIIRRRGREFISSKRKNRIGQGIPSIRRNVEKAEGLAEFFVTDDVFVVEIVIPFSREMNRSANH